jgi:alkaline phosphatase D
VRAYRTVRFGRLADLFLIDTRTHRDLPVPPPEMFSPERSALGPVQREWLLGELDGSRATWRLLGNPSVLARTWNDDLPDVVKRALLKVKLIDADGHGPDHDQWDGYPAERTMLLRHIRDTGIRNLAVLSGDVHVGMAIELTNDDGDGDTDEPVAVEFVNTSLTSQNLDDKMGWAPLTESLAVAEAYIAGMRHIHWADFDSHGYTLIDVTPERIVAEWWAVDTVLERTGVERLVTSWTLGAGEVALRPTGAGEGRGAAVG